MNDETIALGQIELCEENIEESKRNIMMMHCSVGAWYLMQEFGEWVYPSNKEYIFEKMDYVALGHWHGFGAVSKHKNVYYSGSTERTSLNDKRNSKGFIVATLEDKLNIEYKSINFLTTKEENEKREFKKSDDNQTLSDMEAISLEEYFLEHIKEHSDDKEYDRLKSKIQELFAQYEEVEDDIN